MAGFLHGIEHIDLLSDFGTVNPVRTAVIGLIGTADGTAETPIEHNKLYLCLSARDDAQFGRNGTIPEALRAIRMQQSRRGSAAVFVISVAASNVVVTPAQIIGEVTPTGTRTGLKLFETAKGKHGFKPMIYIAPRFSALAAVRNELQIIANKNEAMSYIDSPDGMTFQQALAARGTTGDWSNLDEGIKALFPHFLVANPDFIDEATTPTEQRFFNVPMSAFCAGLRARVDLEHGWHVSSSNNRIMGVEGLDVDLQFSLGDRNSETNLLNAAGITTAVNMFGNGIVEWGNYTAGFPGNPNVDAFEVVRRTRAIMKIAIEQACIPFIDRPFNQANVDLIRNTVNQFLNQLVGQGKIVFGQCFFRRESNPAAQLAKGHLTFDIEFTPSVPMQTLTFTYKIDLTQLENIA